MIIRESNEQPKKGRTGGYALFFIAAPHLCDQPPISVNLIAQTFAAVVDRMRFAVNKALRLRATLFAGLILDHVNRLRYF